MSEAKGVGSSSNEGTWPLIVKFDRDNETVAYSTRSELHDWCRKEVQFWTKIKEGLPQQSAAAMNANLNLVSRIPSDASEEDVLRLTRELSTAYRLSNGPLGRLIARIPAPIQRAHVFNEIANPGAAGMQQLNIDVITARAFVAVYYSLGESVGALDKVAQTNASLKETVALVEAIKAERESALRSFQSLVEKCDVDWKDKIEGFAQKQALDAPKTYWETRFSEQVRRAQWDRRLWYGSLVLVSGGVGWFLWYVLGHSPAGTLTVEAVSAAQRIVVLGTLLAFAVWWLRQKLRDLRSHEFLADDAAERVTMIQTYAAMRVAGLQDANLAPILNALYRPATAAPIDDGGPVLPSEIVLKTMADAVKK